MLSFMTPGLPFGFHTPQARPCSVTAGKLLDLTRQHFQPSTRSWKEDELFEAASGSNVGLSLAWTPHDEERGRIRMRVEGLVRSGPGAAAERTELEIPQMVIATIVPTLSRAERTQIFGLLLTSRLEELSRAILPNGCVHPRTGEFTQRIVTVRTMIRHLGFGRLPGDCDEEE